MFPALAALGGPLFVATALFMVATVIALAVSLAADAHACRSCRWSPASSCWSSAALTLWLQDETFIKMKPTIVNTLFGAVLLGGLALRPVAARLRLRFRLPARRRRLAQAHLALGPLLPRSSRCSTRSSGGSFSDRLLGELQGLRHHAAHLPLHAAPDAADHAPFARRADARQVRRGTHGFLTSREELRAHLQAAGRRRRAQGDARARRALPRASSARARSC